MLLVTVTTLATVTFTNQFRIQTLCVLATMRSAVLNVLALLAAAMLPFVHAQVCISAPAVGASG